MHPTLEPAKKPAKAQAKGSVKKTASKKAPGKKTASKRFGQKERESFRDPCEKGIPAQKVQLRMRIQKNAGTKNTG